VRRVLFFLVVALVSLTGIENVVAERGEIVESPGASVRDGSPEAIVVVGASGSIGSWTSSSGGSGPRWVCRYHPTDSAGQWIEWTEDVDPVAGDVYMLACYVGDDLVSTTIGVFDPADPLGGLAAVERSREEARRLLDLPLPEPSLNPPGAQLVGVPTWFWLGGAWEGASATASVGAVSATVHARPVQATWDLGDGTTLTCDAGVAYDPAVSPSAQASDCTHVFTSDSRRSREGAYEVTVTVRYDVSWDASTGAGGALDAVTRTTTIPVVVQEAQAVLR